LPEFTLLSKLKIQKYFLYNPFNLFWKGCVYLHYGKLNQERKAKSPDHYEEKLAVNGTFMDIINAAVKHTKANTPEKKAQ